VVSIFLVPPCCSKIGKSILSRALSVISLLVQCFFPSISYLKKLWSPTQSETTPHVLSCFLMCLLTRSLVIMPSKSSISCKRYVHHYALLQQSLLAQI
jgi:hypothetical protein